MMEKNRMLRFDGSVWCNLDIALRNADQLFRQAVRPLGLTVIEWYVMRALLEQDGQHASELARAVGRAAMVALLSVLLGKRLALAAWIALGITLIGVMLTVPDFTQLTGNVSLGVMFAIINALIVAIYFLVAERLLKDAPVVGTAYIITGALISLLLMVPFNGLQIPSRPDVWIYLFLLGTFCAVLPIFTINVGIQMIGPSRASIISSTEPVMSMFVAMFLLSEVILPVQWLGAAFIIGAVIVLQVAPRQVKHSTT